MTVWGAGLHEDQNGIKTSQSYGDPGDGSTGWFGYNKVVDGGDEALGAKADAAVEGGSSDGSLIALIKGVQKALGISTDSSTPSGNGSILTILKAIRDTLRFRRPSDATWLNSSSGNVANSAAVASLAGSSGVTNYCTGIEITFAGATAAGNVVATLAGLAGGTISFICTAPTGATVPGAPIIAQFDPPLPASAANTAITLTLPALGSGNTHACVNIHGFRV
jgi:hypothetical protein